MDDLFHLFLTTGWIDLGISGRILRMFVLEKERGFVDGVRERERGVFFLKFI